MTLPLPVLANEPNGILYALLKSDTDPVAILHAMELGLLRAPLARDKDGFNLLGVWMGRMSTQRHHEGWLGTVPGAPSPEPLVLTPHLLVTQALVEGGCDPFQPTGLAMEANTHHPSLWQRAPHGYAEHNPNIRSVPMSAWALALAKGHLGLLDRWQQMPGAPRKTKLDKTMVNAVALAPHGKPAAANWYSYAYVMQPVPVLHAATVANRQDLVNFLLHQGANVNALDPCGRTALFHAHTPEMVSLLLSRGADCTIKCPKGTDAMGSWTRALTTSSAVEPLQQELMKRLADFEPHVRREILLPSLFAAADRGVKVGFEQIWAQGGFAKQVEPLVLHKEDGTPEGIAARVITNRWKGGTEAQAVDAWLSKRKKEWDHETIPGTKDGWWWLLGQTGQQANNPSLLKWADEQIQSGASVQTHVVAILVGAGSTPGETLERLGKFLIQAPNLGEPWQAWLTGADGQACVDMFWQRWKPELQSETKSLPDLIFPDTLSATTKAQLAGIGYALAGLRDKNNDYDKENFLKALMLHGDVNAPIFLINPTTQKRLGASAFHHMRQGVERNALQVQAQDRQLSTRRSVRL